MTIALLVEPADQTVDPGREAVFKVLVVNKSAAVDRVALEILGSAGVWSRLEPPAFALMPGDDATATVVISPPVGTPLGPVALGIRATGETSGLVDVGEANLNVGAGHSIEAELRPRTTNGKQRATGAVVLRNVGSAPTEVRVVATAPDDGIAFDAFDDDDGSATVEIGPGTTAELPLRMRLPPRSKGGATLHYSVLIDGGDTSQSLDGQVLQPARKLWPILAAVLALALVATAIAALRPKDAVAIKHGSTDASTVAAGGGIAPGGVADGATTIVPGAGPGGVVGGNPAPAGSRGAVPAGPRAAPAPGPGAAPGPVGQGTTGPVGGAGTAPGPSGGPAPVALPAGCPPAGGDPQQQLAQRVICSWETGQLQAEIGRGITPEAAAKLAAIPPAPGGQAVRTATESFGVPEGSRVSLVCRTGTAQGVVFLVVNAGLVTSTPDSPNRCP